jgi:hypothetical protein
MADRAVELDPFDPFANMVMGRVLHFSGLPEDGLFWYDRSIEVSPNFTKGHYARSHLDMLAGRYVVVEPYEVPGGHAWSVAAGPWPPCSDPLAATLRSAVPRDPSATFAPVTALFRICFGPTLLFGRVTAAYPTPPASSIPTASVDITLA